MKESDYDLMFFILKILTTVLAFVVLYGFWLILTN